MSPLNAQQIQSLARSLLDCPSLRLHLDDFRDHLGSAHPDVNYRLGARAGANASTGPDVNYRLGLRARLQSELSVLAAEGKLNFGTSSGSDPKVSTNDNLNSSVVSGKASINLMNLSEPPTAPGWSISISHCPQAGGFCLVSHPAKVGFDIERLSRVTESIAKRIAYSADELKSAPSPAHLWIAKEAVFKSFLTPNIGAIQLRRPTTLSEIEIRDWNQGSANSWTFSAQIDAKSPPIQLHRALQNLLPPSVQIHQGALKLPLPPSVQPLGNGLILTTSDLGLAFFVIPLN
jgi:phosphopantetheinyl transferase (holo-ACP synthase)